MRKSIGGYFELELNKLEQYHKNCIKLNLARKCLSHILENSTFQKIIAPYFTCDVVIEEIKNSNLDVEFYHLDNNFEPVYDFSLLKNNDVFLYTNYFGIKDAFISKLSNFSIHLIIDNAQSFFSKNIESVPTFYSARKFFGVPDGAYLYFDNSKKENFKQDTSTNRFNHLLNRIEIGAEDSYQYYVENEKLLDEQPKLQMSLLTERLLSSLDYKLIKEKRKVNFLYLNDKLERLNKIQFEDLNLINPLSFPFWIENGALLREKLIQQKIYCPVYWPSVVMDMNEESLEYKFSKQIVHLPIDQRYNIEDMNEMVEFINLCMNE